MPHSQILYSIPGYEAIHRRQTGIAAVIYGISFGICAATSVITIAFLLLRSRRSKCTCLKLASLSVAAFVFTILYFVPNISSQINYFGGNSSIGHGQSALMPIWDASTTGRVVFQLITWLFAGLLNYMVILSWCQQKWIGAASTVVYLAIALASLIALLVCSHLSILILTIILFLFEFVAYDLIFVRFILNKREVAPNTSAEGYKQLDAERHIIFLIAGASYIITRIFWIASVMNLGGSDIWASPIVVVSAFLGGHLLILHSATSDEVVALCDPIDEPSSSSGPIHL